MEEQINKILNSVILGYDKYTGNDMVRDELIDSMSLLEIVSELEDLYEIEIPKEEMISKNFKSVYSIIELVNKYT